MVGTVCRIIQRFTAEENRAKSSREYCTTSILWNLHTWELVLVRVLERISNLKIKGERALIWQHGIAERCKSESICSDPRCSFEIGWHSSSVSGGKAATATRRVSLRYLLSSTLSQPLGTFDPEFFGKGFKEADGLVKIHCRLNTSRKFTWCLGSAHWMHIQLIA